VDSEIDLAGGDVQRWLRVYADLLRIEGHWTEQVQNQQQRISTTLTMNAFLLGFLAATGLSESVPRHSWPAYLFLASLFLLSVALMMGILALRPGIQISGTRIGSALTESLRSFKSAQHHPVHEPALWLDSLATLNLARSATEVEAVRMMCESVAENQARANHQVVMRNRRLLMYRQLTLVLLGLGLLLAALVGLQFQSP